MSLEEDHHPCSECGAPCLYGSKCAACAHPESAVNTYRSARESEWEIILRYLEEGWAVQMNRHPDKSGPRGEPADSRYPLVYSVKLDRFISVDEHVAYFGRQGKLLDALEQADAGAQKARKLENP